MPRARCPQCGHVQPAADPRPGAVARCAQCGRAFRLKPLPAASPPFPPTPEPVPELVRGSLALPSSEAEPAPGPGVRQHPDERDGAEVVSSPPPDEPLGFADSADPRPAWRRSRRPSRREDDDERPARRDRDDRREEDEDDPPPRPRPRRRGPRRPAGRPESLAEYAGWVTDRFGRFGWFVIGFALFQLTALVVGLVVPDIRDLAVVLLFLAAGVAWLWVIVIALRDQPAVGLGYIFLAVVASAVARVRQQPIGFGPLGLFPGILVPIYALARFGACWRPLALMGLCLVLAVPHLVVGYLTKPAAPDFPPPVVAPPPGTPTPTDPPPPRPAPPPLSPAVIPDGPEPGAVYLSDLPEVGVVKGTWPLGKEGDTGEPLVGPIRVGGRESPRGLGLHPPAGPGYAAVSYRLGKAAVRLKAGVALNDTTPPTSRGAFEVWGDGRRLWESPLLVGPGPAGACEVDLAGVDVLELRTTTPGDPHGVHAVWVEPRLELAAGARLLPPGPPPIDLAAAREPDGAAHLDRLPEYDIKRGPWPYTKDGTLGNEDRTPIAVGGRAYPRALAMVPPDGGFARARFRLGGKAAGLETSVALADTAFGFTTPPVFEVWGDGKRLWRSPPVEERGKPIPCRVDLTGVDVLELRVSAGRHFGVHAVWLDPRLTLPGG